MKRSQSKTDRTVSSSGDRMLSVLDLFTTDEPKWTVEAAAGELRISVPTVYRYFKRLTKAGLISPVSGASYTLGPAIIQMDRQIQICDPMLNAARGIMVDLIQYAAESTTVLLCRLYHDRVMCVHQVMGRGPQLPVSYERGRLMPLFRGATSKIILAHLPVRTLKSLFDRHAAEIAEASLGRTFVAFRRYLAGLRRAGVLVSRAEIDSGRVGVAAPIFGAERSILGSLSFVLPEPRADERLIARLTPLTVAGAREIEQAMVSMSTIKSSPARVKLVR
jgi:DNA-binding IclR family transcriptional regulator